MENSKINHSTKSEIIVKGECQELLKVIRILNESNIKYSITEELKNLESEEYDEDVEYVNRINEKVSLFFSIILGLTIYISILYWAIQ